MAWLLDNSMLNGDAFRRDPASGRLRIAIPENANIAADTVEVHARGPAAQKTALLHVQPDGVETAITFAELSALSTRLAAALAARGVGRGDRIAIHSVQRPQTILAHLAAYKLGAIAATISHLTGPETIAHILSDSAAKALVSTGDAWAPMRAHLGSTPAAELVVIGDGAEAGEIELDALLSFDASGFEPARTTAEDPALLIYTSGSTGKPKGILHGHRILHALNATIDLFYNMELRQPDRVFWTAADWAWVGGLNDVVFPSLTFGHKLIVCDARFEPEWALDFMSRHGVTHTLLTPTALKRIVQAPDKPEYKDLALSVVFTGGESLPGEVHRLLTERFGVVCNEGYGLSEVNQMIGNCQKLRPVKPGSMGWDFPGHRVALVDENGGETPDGEVGEIMVGADDPTLCLGYWGRPDMIENLRVGDWVRTHDLAVRDADGYYWYRGRNDDLIKSAGFRIGPAEIEEVMLQHPAVADVGVIGVPDREGDRGVLVKAFVSPAPEIAADTALAEELRAYVKQRLGPYKQPRLIEFMPELPTTRTGKISRAELRRIELARGAN